MTQKYFNLQSLIPNFFVIIILNKHIQLKFLKAELIFHFI